MVTADPWQDLKQFTQARIAMGRVGSSLPTHAVLDFSCAHAMARDTVHLALDVNQLAAELENQGLKTLQVHSCASDRHTFLLRPDFGRRLNQESCESLKTYAKHNKTKIDLLLVVGDGLSSIAIARHAAKLIAEIHQQLPADWNTGPVVIAQQARVALADEICDLLGATIVAILIGERPGLSSPDSLGIYLTYKAKPGSTDAERNCISNIRPQGLDYVTAAKKLLWLCESANRLQYSGVNLKDESDAESFIASSSPHLQE
jgi:ethanolamine ammonia-lyase small subunit